MKIAYILPVDMKTDYGYTQENFLKTHFSVNIAREVANQGYHVSLHTFWDKKIIYRDEGFKVYFYPSTAIENCQRLPFSRISLELLRKRFSRNTIIHFHEPSALFFDLFSLTNKNITVAHYHGIELFTPFCSEFFSHPYSIFKKYLKPCLLRKCATHIVINNLALKDLKKYRINKEKIYKISHGINPSNFKFLDKMSTRKKLGIEKDKILFLFVGRIDKGKGISELVSAFNKMKKIHPSIELIILGPLQDSSLVKIIEPFWRGFKESNELSKWYSAADVFVLPTYHESFGLVLLEALYYNLPIITTNIAVLQEFVLKKTAIFIPPKDEGALKKAMITVLNPQFRTKKSRGGRRLVKEKFTWEKVCHQYIQIYKKIEPLR